MKKSKIENFIAKKIGRAIGRYNMISGGDKVLVGVSGGKDSLTLLKVLMERRKWLPIDYEVKAVHVITDYDQSPEVKRGILKEYFEALGCEYVFKEVAIVKENKLKREDCFWCAWNRRRAPISPVLTSLAKLSWARRFPPKSLLQPNCCGSEKGVRSPPIYLTLRLKQSRKPPK